MQSDIQVGDNKVHRGDGHVQKMKVTSSFVVGNGIPTSLYRVRYPILVANDNEIQVIF